MFSERITCSQAVQANVLMCTQAIVRGKAIHLSGKPKDFPEMEDDSMEVIINGGMIFLFAFGVPQVLHEDNASTVIHDLADSDLQASRWLCLRDTSRLTAVCHALRSPTASRHNQPSRAML